MNYMLIHPPLPTDKSSERVAGRDRRDWPCLSITSMMKVLLRIWRVRASTLYVVGTSYPIVFILPIVFMESAARAHPRWVLLWWQSNVRSMCSVAIVQLIAASHLHTAQWMSWLDICAHSIRETVEHRCDGDGDYYDGSPRPRLLPTTRATDFARQLVNRKILANNESWRWASQDQECIRWNLIPLQLSTVPHTHIPYMHISSATLPAYGFMSTEIGDAMQMQHFRNMTTETSLRGSRITTLRE